MLLLGNPLKILHDRRQRRQFGLVQAVYPRLQTVTGFTQNLRPHPRIGRLKGKAVCPDGRPFSSGYKLLL
jgi:hypothetical protein